MRTVVKRKIDEVGEGLESAKAQRGTRGSDGDGRANGGDGDLAISVQVGVEVIRTNRGRGDSRNIHSDASLSGWLVCDTARHV